MTSYAIPICASCTRYTGYDDTHPRAYCAAFPAGIPLAMYADGFDHRNPYPGDNGILYDPDPSLAGSLRAHEEIYALLDNDDLTDDDDELGDDAARWRPGDLDDGAVA